MIGVFHVRIVFGEIGENFFLASRASFQFNMANGSLFIFKDRGNAGDAFGDLQHAIAQQIGRDGDFRISPDVAEMRLENHEVDGDAVVGVGFVGDDLGDFAGEAHDFDGVADFKAGGVVERGLVFKFGREPAFALGGFVNVITEAEQQQCRGEHHEPADGAFHAAEAGAKLGG